MRLLRAYAVVIATLFPAAVRNAPAVYDWSPVIVQASPMDWCGKPCAFLPNLGVHRLPRRSR